MPKHYGVIPVRFPKRPLFPSPPITTRARSWPGGLPAARNPIYQGRRVGASPLRRMLDGLRRLVR